MPSASLSATSVGMSRIALVTGATVISPYLGVGELIGVGLGVIAADYLYRTFYRPKFSLW